MGVMVYGSEFGVWGVVFLVDSVWLMVWGSWFRVKGLGLRVQVCVRAQRDIFRHREDTKGPSRFIPFAVSEPYVRFLWGLIAKS